MDLVIFSQPKVFEALLQLIYALRSDAQVHLVTSLSYLESLKPEVKRNSRLISVFATEVVPKRVLAEFGYGCYNLHPGTPDYPGWRAWSFAMLSDAKTCGLTLHEMTEKVDAGKIVSFIKFSIARSMTEQDVKNILIKALPDFFKYYPECLTQQSKLPVVSTHWSRRPFTKRDVQKIIQLNHKTSPQMVFTLVRSFGFGDHEEKPFLIYENKRYVLQGNVNLELEGKDCMEFHGFTFCAENCLNQIQAPEETSLKVGQ